MAEQPSLGQHDPEVTIHIDKAQFKLDAGSLTGAQIRALPTPSIGPEFDLWEDIPGGNDRLIGNDEVVVLHNGQHFFTAPATITPGG